MFDGKYYRRDAETGLALGETTVLTDSDGTLWVYCVKCHKQFHVKCIRADSVNPSENLYLCHLCTVRAGLNKKDTASCHILCEYNE